MTAMPLPDQPDTVDFLRAVIGECEGPVTLFSADVESGDRTTSWGMSADELARAVPRYVDSRNVWFGVATRRRVLGGNLRGGIDECYQVGCLWADVDVVGAGHSRGDLPTYEDAVAFVKGLPVQPSIVVHTGGGLQPYWLLDEPQLVEGFQPTLERWGHMLTERAEAAGFYLDNVFDVARILRVPGTFNRKIEGNPRPVRVIRWKPELRYGIDDVEPWLPAPAERPKELPRDVPYVGPARPGDHFSMAVKGGEVLQSFGWTFHHRDAGGDEHWTRPGKDKRQGSSATVYAADGRTVVWTSSVPELKERDSLTPFKLYAKLAHAGDWSAAAGALAAIGYGERNVTSEEATAALAEWAKGVDPDVETPKTTLGTFRVNWTEFWDEEHVSEDWLIEPLFARGRGHALFAPAKTGKSLLVQWAVSRVVRGLPCLSWPGGAPLTVVYIDYENTRSDLRERLETFGVTRCDDLSALHYISLPAIDPLDTGEGAKVVIDYCRDVKPDLVVIDTLSRAISGEENSADPIKAFYRLVGIHFKGMGIAYVRLDHAGKDVAKGARGTSAKNDDVDLILRLTKRDGGLLLEKPLGRVAWYPDRTELDEHDDDGVLGWRIAFDHTWPAGTKECAEALDRLGVSLGASVSAAKIALRSAGAGKASDVVRAAVKWRKLVAAKAEGSAAIAGWVSTDGGDERTSNPQVRASGRPVGSEPGFVRFDTQNPRSEAQVRSQVRSGSLLEPNSGSFPPPKGGTTEGQVGHGDDDDPLRDLKGVFG